MRISLSLILFVVTFISSQASGQSFTAIADATVKSKSAKSNYGSASLLLVDSSPLQQALLKFSVSGISGTVVSAKVRLYAADSSKSGPEIYETGNNWSEASVTWNNKPGAIGSKLDDRSSVSSGSYVEYNVLSVVKANGEFSFLLKADSSDGTDFSSRESSRPPVLIIKTESVTPPPPPPTSEPPPPTSTASCLDQSGPLLDLPTAPPNPYFQFSLAAYTKVDARGSVWRGTTNIPVKIGGGQNICVKGGSVQGMWDPFTTSWSTYHDTYAFTVYGNEMTVESLRVDNYGDAINIRNDADTGHNFTVRNMHVTNNHDDCFQNDSMKAGAVLDNLFDGCYNFYSSRGYGSGPQNTVRIENNLVRLQGFPTYYGGQAADVNDPSQYRHGGFWKIDEFDKAPKLAIHNNIFRADADSRSWIPLMPDARSIGSCSNNIIVWLGSGPFPEALPSCFKITTDKSVWDNAVSAWKARQGQ